MAFLRMRGICKYYPDHHVLANDHVDFALEQNEIHAIVGENGAGKTTLMKILYGLEQADEGSIEIDGNWVSISSPRDADHLGIGMVQQHFRLVPDFTVAENVTLGAEPRTLGLMLDRRAAVQSVASVMDEYGFDLDPTRRVADLAAGQKQQVEILKILYRNDSIIILDEPTSVLTEQQTNRLFETLKYLTTVGRTIIIITHKLAEVLAVSDSVTVMRRGRTVAVRKTSDVTKNELSRLMVGKSVTFHYTRDEFTPGDPVFELRNVSVSDTGRHRPHLEEVDISVRSGEIVGVTAVAGNGLDVVEEVAAGLKKIDAGSLWRRGEDVTNRSVLFHRENGLAYVPADRMGRGSSSGVSVLENMIISLHHRFVRAGVLDSQAIRRFGRGLADGFTIDADIDARMESLSGGNIQKVVLAREFSALSDFIIFSEPGWGLDVSSADFVYSRLLECRRNRVAILLLSSNLDEILGLADTIIVMYQGRVVCRCPNGSDIAKEWIGEYMLGLRDDFGGADTDDHQGTDAGEGNRT